MKTQSNFKKPQVTARLRSRFRRDSVLLGLIVLTAMLGVKCSNANSTGAEPAASASVAGTASSPQSPGAPVPGKATLPVDNWENMYMPRIGDVWTLNALAFVSADEGWAVGADQDSTKGVVLHYSNGQWQTEFMPAAGKYWTIHLVAIALSGPKDGWAVGDKYYIWADPDRFKPFALRMVNGRWTIVGVPPVGQSAELEGITAIPGAGGAVAVGGVTTRDKQREGLILRFDRGWKRVPNPSVNVRWWELRDVVFPTADHGWAFGKAVHPNDKENSLIILEYKNGSWSQVAAPPAHGIKRGLLCASFPSPDIGYAAGQGALLRYRNGQWEQEKFDCDIDNWTIRSISFTSTEDGWAVGWDESNKHPLWLRRNAQGWKRVSSPFDNKLQELNGIFFLKPGVGWAAGSISGDTEYPGFVFRYKGNQ